MIGNQYKLHRDNVVNLYEEYKTQRGDLNDGVDIALLEKRVASLKEGKFTLAVAGEVKAGKSTFINALLGKEVLPSDVLQASSAIVEIFKSDTPCLNVKYANGEEECVCDELEADVLEINKTKERLHEICKLHDEYRNIPTTLIDERIIKSEDKLVVSKGLIKELEQQSNEALQDKQSVIENFISERTKDKIPVKIELGYPLKWAFDELRIVDSPGVNATGGVQDVAFQFFEQANAILFVHPIKPVESESFRKFVESTLSNRSRETLFLVLTHAGNYSNDEVDRLHHEAKRLYKNTIPQNRILVVDSLLKLIHGELENGVPVKEIRKSGSKKKILSSYREQAEDEDRALIDVVCECARFDALFAAIDKFSMAAPILQLREILEKIEAGCEEQIKQSAEKIERLIEKKEDSQKFEKEIDCINKALDKYELKMNELKEDFNQEYSGKDASWYKDIEDIEEGLSITYQDLINEADTIEAVRKHTIDGINALQDRLTKLSQELKKKVACKLEEVGKVFEAEYQVSTPKVDLDAVEEKSKEEAYREEDVHSRDKEPLWKFWKWMDRDIWVKTGTKKVYDKSKHLKAFKDICTNEFSDIIRGSSDKPKTDEPKTDELKTDELKTESIAKRVEKMRESYLTIFLDEMKRVIAERKKELEQEKRKKQSNDELIKEIAQLNDKKVKINENMEQCKELLGDIT